MRARMIICIALVLTMLSGCASSADSEYQISAKDEEKLVVYTSHKAEVYEPLVREFEEETGIFVEVVTGGTTELLEKLSTDEGKGCDIMFGGGVESLLAYKDRFEPYKPTSSEALTDPYVNAEGVYTVFSSLPIVIIYNDKLVYSESAPEGFEDLLSERWSGKIAFADPKSSGTSVTALATMLQIFDDRSDVLSVFASRVGEALPGSGDVVDAVDAGTKLVGITLEEFALKNKAAGADIKLVYPKEGTSAIPDGVALLKNAPNRSNAVRFIDFVTGAEAQQYIVDNFFRRSVRGDISAHEDSEEDDGAYLDLEVIPYDLEWASRNRASILSEWAALMNGG